MNIAVFGMGLMGTAMAERLLALGHAVSVYNRSPEKSKPLAKVGATVIETPAQALAAVEVVILMLADSAAVDNVLFSQKAVGEGFQNRTIIQMGTLAPEESIALLDRISRQGGNYLEAPVLGSTPEAKSGKLVVMVGSEPGQYDAWRPLFKCFSDDPFYVGPVGKAAALKLALNQLIVALTAAYAYSIGMVKRWDIDLEQFAGILRKGPLYAPQFDKKLSPMLQRDFSNPHFSARHMLKDVRLIRKEGECLGLETAVIRGLEHLMQKTLAGGWAELDYSALYNAVNSPVESGPD